MNTETNISFDHPIKKRVDTIKKSYGVKVDYSPSGTSIQYVFEVAYIEAIEEDYRCEISRKQFFINGKQPKRLVDVLAEKCMSYMYPIQFRISQYGFIQELLNFDQIKKRWKTSLVDLKNEYQGDVAEEYFSQINNTLLDAKTFLDALHYDIVFPLIFFKKPALYQPERIQHNYIMSLPVLPYKPSVDFIGNQKMYLNDNKGFRFEYTGKDKSNNTIQLKHLINDLDFTLQRVRGIYTTADNQKEIRYSVTYLEERDKQYEEESEVEEEIPKEMIKKKKWFPNLFKRNKK